MKTTPEALKDLYVALGGSDSDVANLSTTVDVLNAIAAKYDGDDDAVLNSDAIENIAAVADNIGGGGSSDLSVANVTFVMVNYQDGYYGEFNGAFLYQGAISDGCGLYDAEEVVEVILYYNNGSVAAGHDIQIVSVSGNAEKSGNVVYVYGDCTINYNGKLQD